MADIFYGNEEINRDIDILLKNKKHENREYATDDIICELIGEKDKNKCHHNARLIIGTTIMSIDLGMDIFSLSSIAKAASFIVRAIRDIKERKKKRDEESKIFEDINGRIIYTLNILSEIDITLELYHRFLSYVNQSYLKGTHQVPRESRISSRPEWAQPRPQYKDTKKSKVIRLFYQQSMNAYNKVLISIYNDLGFDFRIEELHDIDAFFEREHPNKLQKLYDDSFGLLIKSKNIKQRIFKYSFQRLYYLIIHIDDIHTKILPHLAYMQSYISRIELLIDRTKCNFKTITTYQKPMKKLFFKLFEFIKKYDNFKTEMKKDLKHKRTTSKIKRYIENILTINI